MKVGFQRGRRQEPITRFSFKSNVLEEIPLSASPYCFIFCHLLLEAAIQHSLILYSQAYNRKQRLTSICKGQFQMV